MEQRANLNLNENHRKNNNKQTKENLKFQCQVSLFNNYDISQSGISSRFFVRYLQF